MLYRPKADGEGSGRPFGQDPAPFQSDPGV